MPACPHTQEAGQHTTVEFFMIIRGPTAYKSKHKRKLTRCEICTAKPAMPLFLWWSNSAIT
jgi:hypothetical protein